MRGYPYFADCRLQVEYVIIRHFCFVLLFMWTSTSILGIGLGLGVDGWRDGWMGFCCCCCIHYVNSCMTSCTILKDIHVPWQQLLNYQIAYSTCNLWVRHDVIFPVDIRKVSPRRGYQSYYICRTCDCWWTTEWGKGICFGNNNYPKLYPCCKKKKNVELMEWPLNMENSCRIISQSRSTILVAPWCKL